MLEKVFGPFKDYSLLLLRIGIGGVFLAHGVIKFASGVQGVGVFFAQIGIPLSGIMAPAVVAMEFFGGLAILLGTGTRMAVLLLTTVMVVAMVTVTLARGFADGYDLNIALLGGLLCLLLAGPGKPALGGDL
ncbi:MAG: DoxX family protein [Candidatus Binatia bacterium]|jgi:uncharacterized membrane protein YphA (DoxX/SURF4 family)|nr:DoxX family protein [Candidatus Binatia bacterium]